MVIELKHANQYTKASAASCFPLLSSFPKEVTNQFTLPNTFFPKSPWASWGHLKLSIQQNPFKEK